MSVMVSVIAQSIIRSHGNKDGLTDNRTGERATTHYGLITQEPKQSRQSVFSQYISNYRTLHVPDWIKQVCDL